ncbi:hypothetical protein SAMN05421878_11437 [Actinobaculum suis]|uniref:AMIN-like domain-containing protein n=1 Tax=Actinobaculum suis TaxID=1657 RepID=A0A1G7E1X4_9ACTO|nr:hypothetical protein [Actinobaculum suis]MDY5153284.1 hypothetical protein [Actinobaculum suis]SDE57718.1 hypothetical protein SAMN05421878_11437 [Actinobaculum suis]
MGRITKQKLYALLACATLGLGACSSGGSSAGPSAEGAANASSSASATDAANTSDSAASASAAATAGEDAVDTAPFITGDSKSADAENTGEATAQIKATRVAGHPGYDRVVVEYENAGKLGWFSSWVDEPFTDGKGDRIDMPGSKFLEVSVAGAQIPEVYFQEQTPDPDQPLPDIQAPDMGGAKVVQGVYTEWPFEGMHTIHIGVDKERPYRVQILDNPARVVIDVATD